MGDNEITVAFKAMKIPIIDAKNPKEATKQIKEIMNGWDVVGRQRTEIELSRTKVIVCKLVKDWVEPYAMEGREVPVVLFSTHPEWKTGTRFDNGLMECTFCEHLLNNNLFGYLVIVFDERGKLRSYNREKYKWEIRE